MAPLSFESKRSPPSLKTIVGCLALGMVVMVIVMASRGMNWNDIHPAFNAMLNASSTLFLVLGFRAIKRGARETHKQFMLSAFASSTLFLISYLTRYAISGTHRYPGTGWDKDFYLSILFSHMILAIVVVPMVLRAIYLAWKGRFSEHRGIAKWTWRIWMYVSVTGVMVYLMLYPLAALIS